MKKLAKTDRFIELLEESLFVILYFPDPPETMDCWHKIKEPLFQRLTRSYYTLRYQLGGGFFQIHLHPDDNNKIEDILDRVIKKYHNDEPYPDIIKEILQKEQITYKDVINEFWELCPDINHIEEILHVSRVKFREVLSQFPDPLENSTEKLLQDNSNYFNSNVSELERRGFISEEESKYILFKIDAIIETANRIIDLLAKEFNKIKEMANAKSMPSNSTNKNSVPLSLSDCFLVKEYWINLLKNPRLNEHFEISNDGSYKWISEKNLLAGLALNY